MFARPLALVVCLLGLLSQVTAAISILTPNSQTTWYKNSTVQLTWSSASGDPNPFRIFLGSSEGSSGANSTLADSVNTDLQGLTILLPQLVDSQGYILYFVNTTNTSQVYATSQPFAIAQGMVANTTTAAVSGGTATTSSAGNIPGPYTPFSSTGVRTATASASATGSPSGGAISTYAKQASGLAAAGMGLVVAAMVLQ
ncbi:hypothetical protein QFC20_001502 [Naganishia adeliensis]|uniref:Uncharacterized protein n=1 Tax=Naganishia adeliensis TaxID=92952 RepID=A0ACC2WT80_9TREE|nr:hypothetical protein QFC20_001502 [Naganishia adeliensis]